MKTTSGIYLYSFPRKSLLACHATRAPWNQWSIPKGLKEGQEESWDVAVRELAEETGIELGGLHRLGTFSLPSVKYQKQNKILESFLVIIDNDLEGHRFTSNTVAGTSIPEIDSWKWISIAESLQWLHESQLKNLSAVQKLIEDQEY